MVSFRTYTVYHRNNLGHGLSSAAVHFYANNSVIYCRTKSFALVFDHLQFSLNSFPSQPLQLGPLLNASRAKCMLFSHKRKVPMFLPAISTMRGVPIDFVTSYKGLGITIDENVTFKPPTLKICLKKTKVKTTLLFFFSKQEFFGVFF